MSATFDPDDIMRAVRAAAKPSSPATTATLLQNDLNRSNVAIVAACLESAEAIYAEKSPQQVEITQASNHGVRPAEISSAAASPVPASFFDHRCSVCGQLARFGYGVRLMHGEEGRWFCAAHRPEAGRA
jgi:hypothetical protein